MSERVKGSPLYEKVYESLEVAARDLNGGEYKHFIEHVMMPLVLGTIHRHEALPSVQPASASLSREGPDLLKLIREVAIATVELAIIRGDLRDDEGASGQELPMDEIARDAWCAVKSLCSTGCTKLEHCWSASDPHRLPASGGGMSAIFSEDKAYTGQSAADTGAGCERKPTFREARRETALEQMLRHGI